MTWRDSVTYFRETGLCMYMCVCVCVCVCMCPFVCVCVYSWICIRLCPYVCVDVCFSNSIGSPGATACGSVNELVSAPGSPRGGRDRAWVSPRSLRRPAALSCDLATFHRRVIAIFFPPLEPLLVCSFFFFNTNKRVMTFPGKHNNLQGSDVSFRSFRGLQSDGFLLVYMLPKCQTQVRIWRAGKKSGDRGWALTEDRRCVVFDVSGLMSFFSFF